MTTDKTITYSSASLRELSKTGIQLAKGQTLVMQDALVDPSTAFTLEAPPDVFETIQVPAKEDHTFGDVMSFGGLEDDEDDSKSYKFVVRADAPEKATFVIREKTMIGFPPIETVHEIPVRIFKDEASLKNFQHRQLVEQMNKALSEAENEISRVVETQKNKYLVPRVAKFLRLPASCEVFKDEASYPTELVKSAVEEQINIFQADRDYAEASRKRYEIYLDYLTRLQAFEG